MKQICCRNTAGEISTIYATLILNENIGKINPLRRLCIVCSTGTVGGDQVLENESGSGSFY